MNQVPVKYVHPSHLEDPDKGAISTKAIPVVPRAALREVVEGLKEIRDDMLVMQMGGCECKNCAHYRLIQRLLAGLGEVGK